MAVDRYTKLVLTVIAVCLVWLSVGGPSLMTPVNAQAGDRVFLAGWVDEKGMVLQFPAVPRHSYRNTFGEMVVTPAPVSWPLPMTDPFK